MIQALLRWPSPSWESELATGVESVDDYLQRIDSGLVGAKSVRRLTLLEARNFLLEALEHAAPEQREQAIDEAAKAFGDPEDIARNQRAERAQMFRKSMLEFGIPFAVLMLIFQFVGGNLTEIGWLRALILFIFHAVFFGFFMSLWETYGDAQSLPASIDKDETGSSFQVRQTRSSMISIWVLIILFGGIFSISTLGLLGLGLFGEYNAAFNGLMALLSFIILLKALFYFPFRVDVTTQTIKIRRWTGSTEIAIEQVVSLDELSGWYRLSPFIFGAGYRLQWLDDHGRQKAMLLSLNGELENADRFQAVIEQALGSQRQSHGPESKGAPGKRGV